MKNNSDKNNGLFGIAILSLVIFFPSQIQGYISWYKNKKGEVSIRGFTLKNSVMMLLVSIGYLLINIHGLIKWKKLCNN